jgi:peptidoglycan/xylan/chitin deacetylase (PgdA/CDA1 family)
MHYVYRPPIAASLTRIDDTLVLCYHAVSDDWPVPWAITTLQLRAQLKLLVERGYRGRTFHDAVTSTSAGPTLVVTFDDAFSSVIDRAHPILSSLGLPATVFAVTDFADSGRALEWPGMEGWRGGAYDAETRGLSWQDLEHLADAGWEIGSHTRTHPRLTQVADDVLANELGQSREACERALGRPCRSLAYPYGDVDLRVTAAAAAAGYEAAATLPFGLSRPTALAWPRIGVYSKDSLRRFGLKVSPTIRRLRRALAPVEEFARG